MISERKAGLPTVRVQKLSTSEETALDFPEPTYAIFDGNNPEFNSTKWRFIYTSMITPSSVFDYDMETGETGTEKRNRSVGRL